MITAVGAALLPCTCTITSCAWVFAGLSSLTVTVNVRFVAAATVGTVKLAVAVSALFKVMPASLVVQAKLSAWPSGSVLVLASKFCVVPEVPASGVGATRVGGSSVAAIFTTNVWVSLPAGVAASATVNVKLQL